MGLAAIIGKVTGGVAGSLVKDLGETIGKFHFSAEEKAEIDLKLKEIEAKHNETMMAHANEIEKAYIADLGNARSMQIEALKQEDKFAKHFVYYLSGFMILAAVSFGVLLLFMTVPEQNKRLFEQFTDMFLFAGAIMVLNFFLGSSFSSRKNNETIRQELAKK